jgi:hypothetical protein
MPLATKIRAAIANPYSSRSLGGSARLRRWKELRRRFPDFEDMRVLDLGGNTRYWHSAPVRPAHVTLVDPDPWHLQEPEDWMTIVVGDACDPDLGLTGFDLCHSNSVIEHVGGFFRRRQFAANVEAAAPHHWVQTPYRYFPLEPHWLFPGFQFLPVRARAAIGPRWPIAPLGHPIEAALGIELIGLTEFRHLFPDSGIWPEKLGGVIKSLVAVR